MKRALAVASALAAVALASPSALAGDDCAFERIEFPGLKAQKVANWTAVFKALRDEDPVPKSDDAIGEELCWEAGCQRKPELIVEVHGMASLVVEAPGGGLWLLADLDFSEFGQCSRGDFTVARAGEHHLLIRVAIGWGERMYCEDLPEDEQADCPGNACVFAGDEYRHWLFDTRSGALQVKAVCGELQSSDDPSSTPAPAVAFDGETFRYSGCGREVSLPVSTVTRCATQRAAQDSAEAMKRVNEGRKLTAKKKYPEAIAAFTRALEVDHNQARAWSGRGYARLLNGQLDAARADLTRALDLNTDKAFQAAIWYNFGLLAEAKKDDMAAVLAFARAYELKPSDAVEKKLKQYQKKTRRTVRTTPRPPR